MLFFDITLLFPAKELNNGRKEKLISIAEDEFKSGWQDSNLRPPGPKPGALPDCATPRVVSLAETQGKVSDFFVYTQIFWNTLVIL